MNRIQKFLSKLNKKERVVADELIARILSSELYDLNVKKLRGFSSLHRVRKGDLRIIFSQSDQDVNILDVSHRNDSTYNL